VDVKKAIKKIIIAGVIAYVVFLLFPVVKKEDNTLRISTRLFTVESETMSLYPLREVEGGYIAGEKQDVNRVEWYFHFFHYR